MKTNALSAFIGVYRRLKILLPGLSYHPALTALRSHRTTTGKDDTDTKMYSLACHLGWGTSVKETECEKSQIPGESAQPLNARSISGLAKVRVPSWFKVTHEFPGVHIDVAGRANLSKYFPRRPPCADGMTEEHTCPRGFTIHTPAAKVSRT